MNHRHRQWLLLCVVLVAVVVAICLGPIPQDPAYHRFADTRRLLGIDNFWNVVSNVPFLLAGLYGMGRARRLAEPDSTAGYLLLCTGAGSAFAWVKK